MNVKNLQNLLITPANLTDYPTIQNLARFYVYEMSGECGLKSSDWACPADGLYESFDFKHYFTEPNRKAASGFLVQKNKAIVGCNAFAHESGIHQDGMIKCRETYEIMTPESVGFSQSKLSMGKHSGRAAFRNKLSALQLSVDEDNFDDLFKQFKQLGDVKKEITDEDIILLVKGQSSIIQQDKGVIWIDGQFIPWSEAQVPILTHGLHYASSVFACVARAFMGAGAAFAAVSCFKMASVWFPSKRFALVSGMFMTAAMLGAVFGQMPLSILVQHAGWRMALVKISLVGMLLGIIYFVIVKDKPKAVSVSKNTNKGSATFATIIRNKQTWFLSLYSGLAFAPVSVFGGLWGVPFLETAYQLSRTEAAMTISFIFIGFAVGAPFWGWLSDFIGRRKPILFFGTSLALLCLSTVIYSAGLSSYSLIVLLFSFGFGASGFFTSFAMIREVFSVILAATVLGFMNTFDSICEALYEPLVGAFCRKIYILPIAGNYFIGSWYYYSSDKRGICVS